jgi:hypothetical protein
MSIRSLSLGAGLILGALAFYVPRPHPAAPVSIAVSGSQPAPPTIVATTLVPLEVRVSIARLPEPKSIATKEVRAAPPAARNVPGISRERLCVNPGASHECQAAFAAALQSTLMPVALEDDAAHQPLRFHKRAAWMRRLETLGKEGIPFMRVPRGPDNELVVGIDRKGVLGFSLQQVSERER